MTTEKPTDIKPNRPTVMATKKQTKHAAKPKKESLQTKQKLHRIACPFTDRFRLQSGFTITQLQSQDGNRDIYKSSAELQTVKNGVIAVSTQSSPTDQSKPTRKWSTITRIGKSTERLTSKPTKSTKMLLKPRMRAKA
jgi:hypothetical protein